MTQYSQTEGMRDTASQVIEMPYEPVISCWASWKARQYNLLLILLICCQKTLFDKLSMRTRKLSEKINSHGLLTEGHNCCFTELFGCLSGYEMCKLRRFHHKHHQWRCHTRYAIFDYLSVQHWLQATNHTSWQPIIDAYWQTWTVAVE